MRTARMGWLFIALACASPSVETRPKDRHCLRNGDCPAEHVCVTNRCLVPCEPDALCVGCADPRDCVGGANQFCDAHRDGGTSKQPLVSREEFCADCHP